MFYAILVSGAILG